MPEKLLQRAAAAPVPQCSNTFQKAVDRFRNGLTEEQKKLFAMSSLQDVEDGIKRVQSQHGPEKKLRNLTRLKKFLEAMSQIEEVVKVFLNSSEVVGFVWVGQSAPCQPPNPRPRFSPPVIIRAPSSCC